MMFAVQKNRFFTPKFELVEPSDWHHALKRVLKVVKSDEVKTVDALLAYVSRDYVTSRIVAQLLFRWLPIAKRDDGLVYKSGSDWQAETGISESQLKTRKSNGALKAMGIFWNNKRANKLHTSHYGLDAEKLVRVIAATFGRSVVMIRSLLFEKRILQQGSSTDQTRVGDDSPLSLTDNHNQKQLRVVNDKKETSFKSELELKLVRAGLKRSDNLERFAVLPDDVIAACIADADAAATAKTIRTSRRAYLRGALENQLVQHQTKPEIPQSWLSPPPSPLPAPQRGGTEELRKADACVECGRTPHWLTKECGCTESNLSEASVTNDVWTAVWYQLELQLDSATFETCLRRAKFVDIEDGVYVISVCNQFAVDTLNGRYKRNVSRVMQSVTGRETEVKFIRG